MAGISRHGDETNTIRVSDYATAKKWIPSYCISWDEVTGECTGYGGGYYQTTSVSADIKGVLRGSSGEVYVNGRKIARVGDEVAETATINIPSGWSGDSTGTGTGRISTGISGVYSNGRQVANIGKSVTNHKGSTNTIATGSDGVFSNG